MATLSTFQKFKEEQEKKKQGGQQSNQQSTQQSGQKSTGLMNSYQQFIAKQQGQETAYTPESDYGQRVMDVIGKVGNSAASRNGEWTADASGGNAAEINALLREYDAYTGDKSGMTEYRNALLDYNKRIQDENQYYAGFGTKDDFNRVRSGYTNFGVGYDPRSYGLDDASARKLRQESAQNDAKEAQRALAELNSARKNFAAVDSEWRAMDERYRSFTIDEYDKDLTQRWQAAKDQVTAAENALLNSRNRMDAYNATWGKVDKYGETSEAAKGTDTSYTGPGYESIADWENRKNEEQAAQDAQAQRADYVPGTLRYTSDTEPTAEDRLGLWRSLTPEQKQDAISSSNVQLNNVVMAGNDGYWDLLTDNEVETYYYIKGQQGQEAANQYLDDMYIELSRRNELKTVQSIENANGWEKAGLTAVSVGANLVGAIPAALGKTADMVTGRTNPYSSMQFFQRYASYIRGSVGQDIGDWTESKLADKFGEQFAAKAGNLANQTFQAVMSGVDSFVGAKTFGQGMALPAGPFDFHVGGYTTVMGLGAFAQRAQEMELKGATPTQIAIGSIGSGILEAFFEDVSMEVFFTNILENPAKTAGEFVKKLAIQMGVEGSEEMFTEMGNIILDAINMGKNSENSMAAREYMRQGMTEEEAKRQVWKDNAVEILWAGYGGAISAGAMAGFGQVANDTVAKVRNTVGNYAVGDTLTKNGRYVDLQEQASALQDQRKAGKLAKRAREVTELARQGDNSYGNTYRMGKVATQIAQQAGREASRAEVAEFRAAAEKYLAGQRDIQHKKLALNVLTRAYEGTTMVPGDRAYMRMIQGDKLTQNILDSIGGKETLEENAKAREAASMRTAASVQGSVLGLEPTQEKAAYDSDNSGQAYLKDSKDPVNIRGIAEIRDGQMYVATDEGQTVKASDVSFGSYGEAALYSAISNMHTDTQKARSLLYGLDSSGMSTQAYAMALQNAYNKGMSGVSYEGIQSYSSAAKLSDDMRRQAWEAGRDRRAVKTGERAAKVDSGTLVNREKGLNIQDSAKEIVRDSGKMNEQQKAGVAAAKVLAEAGLHIEVYASTESERQNGAPNGIYRSSDGTIHIDLNAGDNGQGTVAYALAHETTHFIKDFSATKYQTYADILIEAAESKGISYDSLLDRQLARLSELKENRNLTAEALQELAYDETIAEMSETMLSDTDAAQRVSQELYKQDRTLWEKIKDFFTGLVEKLRSAYKGIDPDSDIGRVMKRAIQDNETVAQAWAEAVVEAGENYQLQDGQKNNARAGDKFSVRTAFANELQEWFDTTTHDERKVSGKRFLVGTTTDVLKSIGVRDYQIYFGGSKIDKILEKNSSMDLDTIKRAVNLLENPILIMQSRTVDDSIVLFGDVYTSGGKPVMLSLLLNPKNKSGEILDYAVITSTYGRRTNNIQNLLDSSQIYYVNEDKNRTDGWLQALGLQLPSAVTKLGSIGKIADLNGNVNSLSDQTETDSFKKWFGDWQNDPAHASKVVNADGTPKVVYHQTDADFTIFDPRHEGAGTRDSDTPFGIFLKSSDKNIGLQGSKQMALYADIKNPLTVENREQLINELQKLSDGYAQALVEHQMLDAEYKRKSDNAIKEMREYMVQWRKDNPGASGRALYDDNRFMQLFDAEDNITDEWESKAREIELRSKEAITKDLEKHGYDGVIIQLDKGSWGRSTDAYIALRPKQVKSATDNIGTFDKNNPDIRFSRRISAEERVDGKKAVEQALSDYRYQRDAEAKAMKAVYEAEREQIATAHQREMNKLEDSYTGKIAAMSKEIIRLLRKYGEQDNSLEKIKEELSKTEEDAAIWQREFKRLLREYDTSGRNIDRLEKKVQAQQNTAKAKVETAKKTEERFKLERVLTDLNRRLLNPTKTLYVPDSLQPALTMAMQSIATIKQQDAQETASRVIARYGAQLERLGKDPVKNAQAIAETEAKLQNVLERRNATVQNALERLQQAYTDLAETNKGVFTQEYNDKILEFISDAKEAIGDTFYGDMSTGQLQAVRNAYTAILNTIRNVNKLHGENLKQGWAETAQQAMAEFREQPDKTPALGKLKKTMEKLSWNNEKPYYAFERMGSSVMMQLYENLRNGEDGWYRDFAKARAFLFGCMDKYHFDQWENNLVEVEMADGEKVALDLQERMSLFAASKREQYLKHLTQDGFILTGSKRGGKDYMDYSSHVLALETVIQIRNGQVLGLTAEQIAFANEMQEYLSTVCAEQNNEVSLALYGVSKAKEKDYWPIKSSAIRSERVRDSRESPGNRQKNAGHMKPTTKNASNAVELRGFMATWADHVNDTAMYHNFALPMEDFYRVYNYNTSNDGIRQQMSRKHGEASVDYVDTFLKDVNGGVRADNRESAFNMMLSGFKKGAVSASLSVAIQQPSAVGRAFSIIDAKYFVGSKVDSAGGISASWEEMKKYAPVVGLKDIGRFDTDMGRSTQELLSGENEKGFMAAVDKFSGWMPEQMDKITWIAMWEAAKRQTKAEHPGLSGDALKAEAGKLFTKCITQTQVYDSVFSRSGNMRSKSVYMKMLTAFMAEPTTTINMMESAVQDIRGKNFKTAGKKISSVAAALILNSLLASLVYAARDDDEEKTYLEKYLSSLASELVDGVNPITYYPGFKDVWSIVQGYDVERNDMSLVSDMYNATQKATDSWKKFLETDPEDEEARKENLGKFGIASLDAAAGLLNMGGIPLKNILRELRGVKNTYETVSTPRASDSYTRGKAIWDGIQENIPAIFRGSNGKTERLYSAIVAGSQAEQERLKTTYSTEQKYENAIVTALADQDSRIRQAAKEKAAGNAKEAERILAEIEAEGNFSRKQIQSAFEKQLKKVPGGSKESVKEQYLNGEIDRTAAIKQLNGVLGMRKKDAEEQVTQWNSVRDTGIEYDEIRDSYLNNSLTESKAAQMLVRYGGKSEDAAKKTVREWGCKKDLDVNYSEVKEAFIDGEITEQQLKNALVRYGGKDAEEAEETVKAYRWQKQHPDSDLSSSQILAFTKELDGLGTSIEAAGIQPDVFVYYRNKRTECTGVDADGDGKMDSGSKKKEILALIDSLPISDSQKDALYFDNGYAASGLKKAPWHRR